MRCVNGFLRFKKIALSKLDETVFENLNSFKKSFKAFRKGKQTKGKVKKVKLLNSCVNQSILS